VRLNAADGGATGSGVGGYGTTMQVITLVRAYLFNDVPSSERWHAYG